MKGFRIAAVAAISLVLCGSVRAQTVPMPPEFQPVRDYIEQGIANGLAPSVSVAVIRDGRVVWAEGFGLADREGGVKATADTIYLLASVSKPLTATGVMALVDQRRVDLDRPANTYFSGAKLRAFAGSADDITVRRLAGHLSGLPMFFDYIYPGDVPLSWEETIRRFGFAAIAPGTQYGYSNLNFALLTAIVESVSKRPWREFQEKTVFDPLQMTRTSDRVRPGHEREAAVPYLQDAAGRFIRVPDYISGHQGASHIRGTANDLARFALMHLNGGTLDGVRVLSAASVKAMQTPPASGAGKGYGLGWMVGPTMGRPTVRHDGNMPGVATVLRLFPEDRAATVVLTNTSTPTMVIDVTTRLARVLTNRPAPPAAAPDAAAPRAPAPGATPAAPVPPVPGAQPAATEFAGEWQGTLAHQDGDIALRVVIGEKGEIEVSFGGRPAQKLTHVSLKGTSLRGQVETLLATRPGFHGIPTLGFRLDREGERLSGVCTASVQNVFILPYWVQLTRKAATP